MCPIRHTRYRPSVAEQNDATMLDLDRPPPFSTLLEQMEAGRPLTPVGLRYAERRRHCRPGPKNVFQQRARTGPRPGERLTPLPAAVTDLHPPMLLPGDTPPPVDDHPFGFRSAFYYPDGRPVPTQPAADYFAYVAWAGDVRNRRIARTVLYTAGTRITVSTVFLAVCTDRGVPPRLWETMVFLGTGRGYEAGRWSYQSAAAARHGHAAIVAAIRTARGPRHRRR